MLVGLPRSGKTSILRVVLQKMSPHETLFLDSSSRPEVRAILHNPLFQFKVGDMPVGVLNSEQEEAFWYGGCSSLILVIDAQDEPYADSVVDAHKTIITALQYNSDMMVDVFVHKMDGDLFLLEEQRTECLQISDKLTASLQEASVQRVVTFHCTSVYDHSIFEALSKVIQRLMPCLPLLEQLLDQLVQTSRIEKAFFSTSFLRCFWSQTPYHL